MPGGEKNVLTVRENGMIDRLVAVSLLIPHHIRVYTFQEFFLFRVFEFFFCGPSPSCLVYVEAGRLVHSSHLPHPPAPRSVGCCCRGRRIFSLERMVDPSLSLWTRRGW